MVLLAYALPTLILPACRSGIIIILSVVIIIVLCMSKIVLNPATASNQKTDSPSQFFRLTAPQVGLLLALNKLANVIDGKLLKNGRYEVRVSNLTEESWVQLMRQFPELKSDNHYSRVSFFTLRVGAWTPVIVLPSDLHLPSPLPVGLLPLLETSNKCVEAAGACTLACYDGGKLNISYRA